MGSDPAEESTRRAGRGAAGGAASGGPGQERLDGVRVVLLRAPDRSGPMVHELTSRGATVQLLPLLDFELPQDTTDLDAALDQLAQGGFSWLLVTSTTTIRALVHRVRQRTGSSAADLGGILPANTRVAAVGETTARALTAAGLRVDLVPGREGHDNSAAGLAAGLAALSPEGRLFLPQSDLADRLLEQTLREQGWNLAQVTAYRTVPYPADPARRVPAVARASQQGSLQQDSGQQDSRPQDSPQEDSLQHSAPVLTLDAFRAAAVTGDVDVVVFTAPSGVRALLEGVGFAGELSLPEKIHAVMIGASTAQEATRHGMPVAAIAADPTPGGIADAIGRAVAAAAQTDPQDTTDRDRLSAQPKEHP